MLWWIYQISPFNWIFMFFIMCFFFLKFNNLVSLMKTKTMFKVMKTMK